MQKSSQFKTMLRMSYVLGLSIALSGCGAAGQFADLAGTVTKEFICIVLSC